MSLSPWDVGVWTIDSICSILNSTYGTNDYVALNETHGKAVITENTDFKIPPGVECVKVLLAVSAGVDGETGSGTDPGKGGNAGEYVTNFLYPVKGMDILPITVGTGNTVIGDLITLLKGGGLAGGAKGATSNPGVAGGNGSIPAEDICGWLKLTKAGVGGEGGYTYGNGGTGGEGLCASGGGGGGANNGGSGGKNTQKGGDASGFGCGGGGCGGKNRSTTADSNRVAGKGSPGIVILEW